MTTTPTTCSGCKMMAEENRRLRVRKKSEESRADRLEKLVIWSMTQQRIPTMDQVESIRREERESR